MSSDVAVPTLSPAAVREAFKEGYHSTIYSVLPGILADYITMLRTTEDIDHLRKGLEFLGRTAGVEAEKKQDTGPVLHTIEINIGRATSKPTISAELAQTIDDVRDKLEVQVGSAPAELPVFDPFAVPSELMLASLYVNDEVLPDAA